jgi:6-phosphogluconate dehydrogenase
MKKIRLCANWDTSENITERLLKQFKTPEIDLTNIEFVELVLKPRHILFMVVVGRGLTHYLFGTTKI